MKATCSSQCPAFLSPTGVVIEQGDVVEYTKIIWRNGEHHLVLPNGKQVPAIFFETEE